MARISGVDLPKEKIVLIGLTYVYGIGRKISADILTAVGIEFTKKVKDLTEDEVVKIRSQISNIIVEGDLKRRVQQNIRRLYEIGCYRGQRHKWKLPTRGQRTHTNARSRKGKRVAIAGKKKVTK